MGKLKYVKFKDVIKSSKSLSKKLNKSSFKLFIDIYKSAFKYGSSVLDYVNFEFYLLNDDERGNYLTQFYYDKILNKYYSRDIEARFNDKIKFYNLFKDFLYRDFLDLRNVTFKDFKDFIINKEKVVVRKIDGSDTQVISIDKSKLKNEYNVLKIYNNIMKNEHFIVEDYLLLDKDKSIYSDNIRVSCFINESGVFNVLGVILKNGDKLAKVSCEGEVITSFIDSNDVVSHKDIIGFKIPNYDNLVKFVNSLMLKISNLNYANFDIAVVGDKFVFVDINVDVKPYQPKYSVGNVKNGDLDIYKKYMDL